MNANKGLLYLAIVGLMLGTGATGWAQATDKAPTDRAPADRAPRDRPPGGRPPGDRPPGDRLPGDRPPGDRPSGGRPPGGRAPTGLMGVIDRNGNGTIEADEIDMAVVSLRKLDRNKDGKVTRDEVGGSASESSRRFGWRLPSLSSLDKDSDGKLSKEEAPERMRENFERMDTNGDGFIDSKEFDAILQRIRSSQQRPGQRPSRRPGGREPGEGEGGSDQPRRPTPKKEID